MTRRITAALIGCGAVAQSGYLPACRHVSGLCITHAVDTDPLRAKRCAREFDIPEYATNYCQVVDQVDAAIITTPPRSHTTIARECLDQGVHVLCEKPVGVQSSATRAAVELADRRNCHYAVMRHRREVAGLRLAKHLIDEGTLGSISRIEITEGRELNWEFKTTYRFEHDSSRVGTLADIGPYLLDLLLWFFDQNPEVIEYTDDSVGGVEANAELELSVGSVAAMIEISDTRALDRIIRISGKEGQLEAPLPYSDLNIETVRFRTDSTLDEWIQLQFEETNPARTHWRGWLALHIERFVDSVRTGACRYVPAADALPLVEAIEKCYDSRDSTPHPWEEVDRGQVPTEVSDMK